MGSRGRLVVILVGVCVPTCVGILGIMCDRSLSHQKIPGVYMCMCVFKPFFPSPDHKDIFPNTYPIHKYFLGSDFVALLLQHP